MKILIAYYSRTGNTAFIGKAIAAQFKAETDEIADSKSRSGIIGWIRGGKDAFMNKTTSIEIAKKPENYDLVIIGTPIWAGTMVPAIRTYLTEHKLKKVAFFCTAGDKEKSAFIEMQMLSKKPLANMDIKAKNVKQSEHEVKSFCAKIKKSFQHKTA